MQLGPLPPLLQGPAPRSSTGELGQNNFNKEGLWKEGQHLPPADRLIPSSCGVPGSPGRPVGRGRRPDSAQPQQGARYIAASAAAAARCGVPCLPLQSSCQLLGKAQLYDLGIRVKGGTSQQSTDTPVCILSRLEDSCPEGLRETSQAGDKYPIRGL